MWSLPLTLLNLEPTNTAPVANLSAPTQVNAGDTVTVDASGSTDAEGDALTYTWTLPSGVTGSGSSISFVAAEYEQDTTLNFSVTVSDGELTNEASASVVVLKKSGTVDPTCDNPWDAATVYTGGDQVTQDGTLYEAKWWTQGQDPSQAGEWGVWENLGAASCD